MQLATKGFIPTKHSKICSDHFHQNDFEQNIGDSYLLQIKVTAIPSIFPNYSEIISKAKMQCLDVESFIKYLDAALIFHKLKIMNRVIYKYLYTKNSSKKLFACTYLFEIFRHFTSTCFLEMLIFSFI